jgi:hypothetical protein
VSVTLRVSAATARTLGLKRGAKQPVKVGAKQATVPSGSATIGTPLGAKARRALRNARKVTLSVTVVIRDAAGNRTSKRMSIPLKR